MFWGITLNAKRDRSFTELIHNVEIGIVAHYLSYIFCIALLSLLTLTTAHNIRNPLSQPLDLDLLTSIEQQDMTTHTSDESIFDRKTFLQTRFGRLPIELLQNVTRHLNKHDLAAVARISPELRALAERQLYPDIHLPYVAEDYGKREGDHMEHWPLCQTLSLRPDLAQRVSSMDIIAQDVQHDVEVQSMQLLPGQVYFPATFHIEIPQGTVTGKLLQRLPNLKHLDLTLPSCTTREESTRTKTWRYTCRDRKMICYHKQCARSFLASTRKRHI
jgi:hypothetical protein